MLIVAPYPIVQLAAASGTGGDNLLTPSPREVWNCGVVGTPGIDIDLGEVREVDSFFFGFTNAHPDATLQVVRLTEFGGAVDGTVVDHRPLRAADSLGPRHHGFARAAPVSGRYFRFIVGQAGTEPMTAGVLMVGKAFAAPYDFGGGRQPIDTGTKEPLEDGGFGIGEGVVKAGLRWTFGDLAPADRRALWALTYGRGETRPLVVVEELGEDGAGLGEEIHYGLFDRFQAYERVAPGQTRWSLSMTEWA